MTIQDKINAVMQAYADWRRAECNFKKWWTPSRRLSEDPQKGAEAEQKCLAFSRRFKEVFGVVPPHGFGSMTLRRMARIAEEKEVRQ